MSWMWNGYSVALLVQVLVLIGLLVFVWPRRGYAGARTLAALCLALVVWSLGYAIGLGYADVSKRIFWAKVQYFGIAPISYLMFVMVLRMLQWEHWLTWRNPFLVLLAANPIVIIVLVWTNEWHHLIWVSASVRLYGDIHVLMLRHGTAFWIHAGIHHLGLVLCFLLLLRSCFSPVLLQRRQSLLWLIGISAPWLANVMYLFQLGPRYYLDLTPFAFAVTLLCLWVGLLHHHFLDLRPIAREVVFSTIPSGMIVLESAGRIVDMNPAAQRLTDLSMHDVLGRFLLDVFPTWRSEEQEDGVLSLRSHIEIKKQNQPSHFPAAGAVKVSHNLHLLQGLDLHHHNIPTWSVGVFELQISSILDAYEARMGYVVVLYDVTELKRIQQELRDMATRDVLTGCLNRRAFFELATRAMKQAMRYQRPFSVMMIDLDFFKKINDTHGHLAGDQVLQEIAQLFMNGSRDVDIFGRYGGEEFVLAMPELSQEQAIRTAHRFLDMVRKHPIVTGKGEMYVTFSAGVASLTPDIDNMEVLLERADQALYQAKHAGRNCVVVADMKQSSPESTG